MKIIDPVLADFKKSSGDFNQMTGHYSKTFNDLDGMYENELEFQTPR